MGVLPRTGLCLAELSGGGGGGDSACRPPLLLEGSRGLFSESVAAYVSFHGSVHCRGVDQLMPVHASERLAVVMVRQTHVTDSYFL